MTKLEAAQLQVILPGSRISFRRRVVDALREVVPSSGGFCFFGKDDVRAFADSTRVVDGTSRPLAGEEGRRLSQAFGFDPQSVVAGVRRAFFSTELWPDRERARLPYVRECSAPDGFTSALLLFLHEGGVLFGLAGLERRANEPAFTEDDKAALERLGPFLVAGARAHLQYDELAREAAALRALGHVSGAVYVIDRDRRRVVFAIDRERGIDWDEEVTPIHDQLVEAAEQALAARARGDALPTPPRLPSGTVVSVVRLEGDPVFGGTRCAAVRVQSPEQPAALEGLSKRERDIARLLIAGYSGVNVAAISGLSENTVRTYVRRLYAKLGVNNRADLVRKLVSPEPSASAPSTPLGAPPDSSLVEGDDTLD
ncbi:MAG: helix-turn-helix transcriptional regulator [Polyangiaceae bacterium]|nr:helix-turn-helix transcriptional regulator [Polyangiaceae bacterium]